MKMVDLSSQYLKLKLEIDYAIKSVIDSERFIGGDEVSNFGKNFASYNNVKHVIPCGNGTDALQIALMAEGFKPGSEVLVPSFTFVATAESVALLGLKPVFIDIDPNSFTIDPGKIKEHINKNTVAILPVHLYGQNANMAAILKIAKEHNLKVIEDAAQSIGSNILFADGSSLKSGTVGHIGTTSFFPSKNLGAFGDGGAILTNDDEIAETCKQIANHGQSKKYDSKRIGINSRLDAIQAAILNVKLKHLDNFNKLRQERAAIYDELLCNINGLTIPERVNYSSHVFHQYTVKVPALIRESLRAYLDKHSVPTMVYYPKPIHRQSAYSEFAHDDLANTDISSKILLSLPMYPELPQDKQEYISQLVVDFFKTQI